MVIVLSVVVGIFALFGIFYLINYLCYHRSLISTFAEWYLLRYKKHNTKKVVLDKLLAVEKSGEKEYIMPKRYQKLDVSEQKFSDMKVYYLNTHTKSSKVIFYLHGGGYANDVVSHHFRLFKSLIKKTDALIILPIYYKIPKHYYQDCYEVLVRYYESLDLTNKEVVMMGDSSGGGLACGLVQRLAKENVKMPAKTILISPWLDIAMQDKDVIENEKNDPRNKIENVLIWSKYWARELDYQDPKVSPLFGNVDMLKDVYLFVGTKDMLLSDSVRFYDKLQKNNISSTLVVKKNLNHDYPIYPTREGKQARDEISRIINLL